MIVKLSYFKEHGYIKGVLSLLKGSITTANQYKAETRKLVYGEFSTILRGYPELMRDQKSQSTCDSCMKCSEHCPTGAISIAGEAGKQPKSFDISLSRCTLCAECIELCPQNSLIASSQDHSIATNFVDNDQNNADSN